MTHSKVDVSAASWRKSSYSDGADPNSCVEVADGFPGVIPVRGSKDPEGSPLVFPARSWAAFVGAVKAGELPSV
jgi:hypothetical protein